MKKILAAVTLIILLFGAWYYFFRSQPVNPFQVISPNGGEVLQQGTTRTVTWIYHGPETSRPTRIFIQKGPDSSPQFMQAIAASLPTTPGREQTFDWQVPSDFPEGNDYTIEVDLGKVADNDSLYYDSSDGQFSLSSR